MAGNHNLSLGDATIGVITALPVEYAAACGVLECVKEVTANRHGDRSKYAVARVAATDGGYHTVAVALLPDMGNNTAAICATRMLDDCPSIKHVIMSGIAGAAPNPCKPNEHVRLGDIVVSSEGGVLQYDFGKALAEGTEIRSRPRPPSSELLGAVRRLESAEFLNKRPWEEHIDRFISGKHADWERPPEKTDILLGETEEAPFIQHPVDPVRERNPGKPRVFRGVVASSNSVLKDPQKRDSLRDTFHVRAVEMEGSGIADATWQSGRAGYLVVRGTCDYCDQGKNDIWHKYAALVAASYTRAIIEELPTGSGGPALVSVTLRAEEQQPVMRESVQALEILHAKVESLASIIERVERESQQSKGLAAGTPSLPDLRTTASASLQARSITTVTDSQHAKLITDKVEGLCLEIKRQFDYFEVDLAIKASEQLGQVVADHEAIIPGDLLRRAYKILASVSITRAKQASSEEEKKRHISQGRSFLEKARHVTDKQP